MSQLKTTVEFKKLNVVADFVCEMSLVDGYYNKCEPKINIGCHVGILSNLYLSLDKSSVRVLDKGKPCNLLQNSKWGGPNLDALQPAIQNYVLPEKERVRIFREIASRVYREDSDSSRPKGFTYVFMSDNMNSYSGVFPKNSGISKPEVLPKFKTSDFANWLINEKIGIVVGSPISRNQYHQNGPDNFSMTQAFIWIPPHFAKYSAPDTAFVSGAENMPSADEWRDQLKKAAGTSDDAALWRDGVSLVNRAGVKVS